MGKAQSKELMQCKAAKNILDGLRSFSYLNCSIFILIVLFNLNKGEQSKTSQNKKLLSDADYEYLTSLTGNL
jgi:hypothetical protein